MVGPWPLAGWRHRRDWIGLLYLALKRGKASEVVPVIGIYPAVTAVLAVVFLGEGLTALQLGGVALAVAGVLVVGLGG